MNRNRIMRAIPLLTIAGAAMWIYHETAQLGAANDAERAYADEKEHLRSIGEVCVIEHRVPFPGFIVIDRHWKPRSYTNYISDKIRYYCDINDRPPLPNGDGYTYGML